MPKNKTALSVIQQAHIIASIEHLLDLPTTVADFTAYVNELEHFLLGEQDSINEEFILLKKILCSPERYLHHLEKLNEQPINNHEVQEFIIDWLKAELKHQSKALEISFKWSSLEIKQNLGKLLEQRSFITQSPVIEPPTINSCINDPDKMYTLSLDLDENYQHVTLHLNLGFPDDTQISDTFYLNNSQRENLEALGLGALLKAEEIAYEEIKKWLTNRKIPGTLELPNYTHAPKFFAPLLTEKIYLNTIAQKKFFLHELMHLEKEEYESLRHPAIKTLLSSDIISLAEAKKITAPQRNILNQSVYFSLLKDYKIKLHDLIGIFYTESKILCHPLITHLIQQQKVTFREAKYIPEDFIRLCDLNFYLEYFHKAKINWQQFRDLGVYDYKLLLSQPILSLLQKECLSIDELLKLSSRQRRDLAHEQIHKLIMSKKISLEQFKQLSSKTLFLIKSGESIDMVDDKIKFNAQNTLFSTLSPKTKNSSSPGASPRISRI